MDIVYVRGLEVKTVIGVYEWEREIKQPVTVDLDMASDISEAAKTDDHKHVLDYKVVCVRVTEFIEKSDLQLLEAMAEEIAKLIRSEFHVPWVRVRIGKPAAITGAKDVGVVIERGVRQPGATW
jgi:dihydroneopterin aldolase